MGDVSDFPDYRMSRSVIKRLKAQEDPDGPARCHRCGNEWFNLYPYTDSEKSGVTLTNSGRITGYAGELVCLECDLRWEP